MSAPESKKQKHAGGRPTLYKRVEHCRVAFAMGLMGATDAQVADAIGISIRSFLVWKKVHPEFLQALKDSREEADSKVSKSLYERALGYSHKAVKIFYDSKAGRSVAVPYTEHYPPDPTSCIFWLKNRRPDAWREKQPEVHVTQNTTTNVEIDLASVVKRAREIFERKHGAAKGE